jgi:hypothetical protein
VAGQVVNSEVKRLLLLRQGQQKYQELFEELVEDSVISEQERVALQNARQSLQLPDDLVREVEVQFQFTEEGTAPTAEGANP